MIRHTSGFTRLSRIVFWMLLATLPAASLIHAGDKTILVQSTTSTANSGLYDFLLPVFEEKTGLKVHVVAVGTGQAIRNARNCDADVLIVHAKTAEQQFVEDGFGIERFDLMYNDFVLVGPPSDPAGIKGEKDVLQSFKKIAENSSRFASRGDDSGTHKKEMALWEAAGIDPVPYSGDWYRETGSGMGATLMTGLGMNAHVMTDRATWISFKRKADFTILVAGDTALFNQYGVIAVNPDRCPRMNLKGANQLVEWLTSEEGQETIASYQVDGQQLFFPNASANN